MPPPFGARVFLGSILLVSFSCFGGDSSSPIQEPITEEPACAPLDPTCVERNGKRRPLGATVQSVSGVTGSSCARLGDRIFCFGGTAGGARFDKIWEYDYTQDQFLTDRVGTLPTGREHTACVGASDSSVYCFGGFTGEGAGDPYLSEIVQYNPVKDLASLKNLTLPSRRGGLACAAGDNDRLYCFGGTNGIEDFDTILEYDFQRDSLIFKKSALPTGRKSMACVSSSGFIFCFGGSEGDKALSSGLVYDYRNDILTSIEEVLPEAAASLSCVEAQQGIITCLGGSNGTRDLDLVSDFQTGDLLGYRGEAVTRPSLPFGRSQMSCSTADGKIYCFGGVSSSSVLGAELTDVLRYDSADGASEIRNARFEAEAVGLSFLSCAATADRRAYCFGGLGGSLGSGTQTRRILKYDYPEAADNAKDRIEVQQAVLPTFRAVHTCVSAGNGKIYCFGGLRGSPFTGADLSDIIEYDPASDSETAARTVRSILPRGRWGMGCAEGGGRIYCLGGVSGNVIDPARSIVYDEILEFDPDNPDKAPKQMAARLPSGRALLACAPALTGIYCFGGAELGENGLPAALSDIVEYDYTRDFLAVKETTLNQPLLGLSCAPASGKIYCFGGAAGVLDRPTDQIFEYDPGKDVLTVLGITMPSGRLAHSCTRAGANILCFGGFPESLFFTGSPALANSLSQVFEYCPPPCGATAVTTTAAE